MHNLGWKVLTFAWILVLVLLAIDANAGEVEWNWKFVDNIVPDGVVLHRGIQPNTYPQQGDVTVTANGPNRWTVKAGGVYSWTKYDAIRGFYTAIKAFNNSNEGPLYSELSNERFLAMGNGGTPPIVVPPVGTGGTGGGGHGGSTGTGGTHGTGGSAGTGGHPTVCPTPIVCPAPILCPTPTPIECPLPTPGVCRATATIECVLSE